MYSEKEDTNHLVSSSNFVEQFCTNNDMRFDKTKGHYVVRVDFGQVAIETWTDGVRFSTRLGKLKNKPKSLKDIIEKNTSFTIEKLSSDQNETYFLSVELPHLDNEKTTQDAFDLIRQRKQELSADFK